MKRILAFLALLAVFPILSIVNNAQANVSRTVQINTASISIIADITSSTPDDIGMPANAAMDQQRTTENIVANNSVNILVAQAADFRANPSATIYAAMVEESNGLLLCLRSNEIAAEDNRAAHRLSADDNSGETVRSGFGLKIPNRSDSVIILAYAQTFGVRSSAVAFKGTMSQSAAGTHRQKNIDISMAARRTDYNRSPGAGHRPI